MPPVTDDLSRRLREAFPEGEEVLGLALELLDAQGPLLQPVGDADELERRVIAALWWRNDIVGIRPVSTLEPSPEGVAFIDPYARARGGAIDSEWVYAKNPRAGLVHELVGQGRIAHRQIKAALRDIIWMALAIDEGRKENWLELLRLFVEGHWPVALIPAEEGWHLVWVLVDK